MTDETPKTEESTERDGLKELLDLMARLSKAAEQQAAKEEEASEHPADLIQIEIGLSRADDSPRIRLAWGDERGVFTPEMARGHSMNILSASMLIELLALLHRFFIQEIDADEETTMLFINKFRSFVVKHGYGSMTKE